MEEQGEHPVGASHVSSIFVFFCVENGTPPGGRLTSPSANKPPAQSAFILFSASDLSTRKEGTVGIPWLRSYFIYQRATLPRA